MGKGEIKKGDIVIIRKESMKVRVPEELTIGSKGKVLKVKRCVSTEVAEVRINNRTFVIPTHYLDKE